MFYLAREVGKIWTCSAEKKVTLEWLMNSNLVKPEKFGHLHLVYHFTVPLTKFFRYIREMIRKLVLILSSFVLIRFYLIFFISGLFYGFPELSFQGILILSRDPRYTLDIELASCILPLVLSWIVRNQPTSAVLQESSDRTNCKILFHSSTKPKDLGNEMVMEYLFFSENVVLLMRSFAIFCPSLGSWGCFSPAQIWYYANHNSVDLFLFLIIFYEFLLQRGGIYPVFHEVNILYFPSCLKSSNRKANLKVGLWDSPTFNLSFMLKNSDFLRVFLLRDHNGNKA